MFVKIENYTDDKPLIVNVDNIVAIDFCLEKPRIVTTTDINYVLTNEQYTELCKILTTRG